jgi:hypothetical protein
MTLAASGTLSMGGSTANRSVNLELSQAATAQISLNDTNVRSLAGVPSGAITLATDFYGKSAGATVNFNDAVVSAAGVPAQSAGYRIDVNGFVYQVVNGVDTSLGQWVTPTSAGGNYEVFATVTSGSVSSGTTGSWVATSGSPLWTRVAVISGTINIVELVMDVRATGTGTVLDSWSVTLEAERF